jgi:hypothetical protein
MQERGCLQYNTVLIEWFAAFGVAQQWVTDQGSHFKNKVMTDIQKQLGNQPFHNGVLSVGKWYSRSCL